MRSRRRVWTVFVASGVAVVAALGWISVTVVRLEAEAALARHQREHDAATHLALWRMDGWIAARLAPEAARPATHYLPHWDETPVNEGSGGPGGPQTLRYSPLLNYRSPLIRLHFQVWEDGRVTSPQAPYEALRARLALPPAYFAENDRVLAEVAPLLGAAGLRDRIARLEEALDLDVDVGADSRPGDDTVAGRNRHLQQQRVQQLAAARRAVANVGPELAAPAAAVEVGPLVAVWLGGTGDRLAFVRRVTRSDMRVVQGFLVDWDALVAGLLGVVADDFPAARIEPVAESRVTDDTTGSVLASVPAQLVVDVPPPPPAETLSWTRAAVLLAWLASLGALGSAAAAVRSSLAHAERRDRFASAVTHELRTPLTSFRMVADLLADDMVPDPARRREHLESLRGEAERLSAVVENVLAYAQVERGGGPVRAVRTDLGALAERLRPVLQRRAQRDGVEVAFAADGDPHAPVSTDPDVLQRIALNLLDNACKYGAAPVTVTMGVAAGRLQLDVEDSGPGVPEALERAIFEPFDRGRHAADAAASGVGLGLPLSRALARRLGGDLVLRPARTGASFRLSVPA